MSNKTIPLVNIKVRKFEIKDLNTVLEIERICFKDPYPEDFFRYYFYSEPEVFFVAELEGKVVGYSLNSYKEGGHVISIAVMPEYQKKGIGSKLLNKGLEVLKFKKCRLAKAEVRKSNITSQKFFEKHGFKKVGEVKSYYKDGEDAFIYQKELS